MSKSTAEPLEKIKEKKEYGWETLIFIFILVGTFTYIGATMGIGHMFSTIMKTAYSLLMESVLYITAICVLTGALGSLMAEFGVVALMQKVLSPLMRPIYGLPGAASLGIITTFLSDNPAILTLAKDKNIVKYFKKYQVAALTNIGTAFGMGLIVCTFMIGLGSQYATSALIGVGGAVVGSIVSTRIMLILTKKYYKRKGLYEEMDVLEQNIDIEVTADNDNATQKVSKIEKRSAFSRFLNAMLDGGKGGVEIGFSCIPGVLIICTAIMMLTFGPGTVDGAAAYTGAAYEGIGVLPKLGDLIYPVTNLLFGFQDGSNIAFPIISLGAVGAAMGMVPSMLEKGLTGPNEIAVFTAMGMCWSGYLSTHVSMMDALHRRELTGTAIGAHTIGGIAAGVAAHYIYLIFM